MDEILKSEEYRSFRSTVPQKKIIVDDGKEWTLYDAGPKSVRCPIIFLPPASGTADIFFRQMLSLSSLGYRSIAVNHPITWTTEEWATSFYRLLNYLEVDRIHIFGASLGGFLAQKFAQYTSNSKRVVSLILCNAFVDTAIFHQTGAATKFWMVPTVVLKKMVMGGFERHPHMDVEVIRAVEFMEEKLDSLSQEELAARLTLNCASDYVMPQAIHEQNITVTILTVCDYHALSSHVQDEMSKCYPDAKNALLKSGGNFPYLSRSAEVNVYIQVHLRPFNDTPVSAMEIRQPLITPATSDSTDVDHSSAKE